MDLSALPRVTFTSPQVAAVGLTEAQARDAGHEVKVSNLPLRHVPRELVNGETHGLFNLVADARTDSLLGAHVLTEMARWTSRRKVIPTVREAAPANSAHV